MNSIPSETRVPAWLTERPIAHRGLHALPDAPENSLAAFAAAVEAGTPIELDVRLLADGEVVVFHDGDLERLTGVAGAVAEWSANAIRPLRLLGTDERVPLLRETLDFVAGRVPLLIEIKADSALPVGPLEAATLQLLEGYAGAFAVQSFLPASVAYLAAQAPRVVRGQLASDDAWHQGDEHATREESALPDFLAYRLDALPTPLSSALRARGVPLLAWTIQTPPQQSRARSVADNYIFETLPEPPKIS